MTENKVDLRVRACIKCREFIHIVPDSEENIRRIEKFNNKHRSHAIITLPLEEIKGSGYSIYDEKKEKLKNNVENK